MLMQAKQVSNRRAHGLVAVLVAAGLGLPGMAEAVEHGVYMAADYGNTRFGREAASFDAELEPFLECSFSSDIFFCDNPAEVVLSESSLTSRSKGYDVWVGYQFTPWFAVEGAYLIMGKTRHRFDGTMDIGPVDVDGDGNVDYDGPQPLQGRTTFRTRGPAVAAVGSVALGRFVSLDARAGLYLADNQLKLELQHDPPTGQQPYTYRETDGKTSLFYGASANFWITPYFGIRAGVTASSNASFGDSVRHYYLGIRYSYGY
jgi:hypothetical protein